MFVVPDGLSNLQIAALGFSHMTSLQFTLNGKTSGSSLCENALLMREI